MEKLIHNFGIDWKLLAAQAVNFFLLLIILKKFAYAPILTILRARKERIEKGICDAEMAEAKLRESESEKQSILKHAHGEALSIMDATEAKAKSRDDALLAESHKKVEHIVADAKRLIKEEKAKTGEEVFRDTKELVRLGLIKVLGKLPPKDRDAVLIEDALKELRAQNL